MSLGRGFRIFIIDYLSRFQDQIAYVMSNVDDVPSRQESQDAASTIGYRAPKGRSYLYKGHEWMPIGDHDYM